MNDSLAYQKPMQIFDGVYQNGAQIENSSMQAVNPNTIQCFNKCECCGVKLPTTWDKHLCWCPYHKNQVPVGDGTLVLTFCIIVYVFYKKIWTSKKVIR